MEEKKEGRKTGKCAGGLERSLGVGEENGNRSSVEWVGPSQSQLFWSPDSCPTSQVRPRLKGTEHGAPTPSSQNPMVGRVPSKSAYVKIHPITQL